MANGNFAGGTGTKENPYLIEDAHDLNAVRNNLSDTFFALINDIDMDVEPYKTNGWAPIYRFYSSIDGNGYKIKVKHLNEGNMFKHIDKREGVDMYIQNINFEYNVQEWDASLERNASCGIFAGFYGSKIHIRNIKVGGRILYKNAMNTSIMGPLVAESIHVANITNCHIDVILDIKDSADTLFNPSGQKAIGVGGMYGTGGGGVSTNILGSSLVVPNILGSSTIGAVWGNGYGNNAAKAKQSFIVANRPNNNYAVNYLSAVKPVEENVLKLKQTYIDAGWEEELLENGKPVWFLEDGEYPKLWFEKEPTKFLIETDKGMEDGEGNVISILDFETYGFELNRLNELINSDKKINKIYTDNTAKLTATGDKRLKGGKLLISQDILSETIPKATIKGYTSPQLVKPTKDLPLRQVKEAKDIRIKGQDPKNKVRIICSLDEGETWKGYKNDSLIDIDSNNFQEIIDNGLSIVEFNSLKEKWNDILFITEKLRFAYFLDIDDIDDIVHVDDLIATIDMYGYWSTLEKGEDYQYRYSNNNLSVNIYKNGTYKVNYSK